jgi:hypothetical protein
MTWQLLTISAIKNVQRLCIVRLPSKTTYTHLMFYNAAAQQRIACLLLAPPFYDQELRRAATTAATRPNQWKAYLEGHRQRSPRD